VFHSPQAGQRPIHFELSLPQELQYQTVLAFVAIVFSFHAAGPGDPANPGSGSRRQSSSKITKNFAHCK
jgi:hypothetical protein